MNQINIELTKEQITSITKQVRDSGEADYRLNMQAMVIQVVSQRQKQSLLPTF